MKPFIPGRRKSSKEQYHRNKRNIRNLGIKRSVKLRENYGIRDTKNILRSALLNVDGLNEVSIEEVKTTVHTKKPDVVVLLETKRRTESCDVDVNIPGYSLHEARRSDAAGDRDGGGIALYTRLGDGLVFNLHNPDIIDKNDSFVNSERVWVTVQSQSTKTALCGLYLGCQYSDDRHGHWNDTIYRVVQQEAFHLRSKGYRVVFLGDFNGHVGCVPGQGVPGNNEGINANGRRFLDFLANTDSKHVNGESTLTTGLWTRQRGGHSSVIDYAVVSREHMNSVISLHVDDTGELGGGSDHNWLILDISDSFVKLKRKSNVKVTKTRWNISDDQDWSSYKEHCKRLVPTLNNGSVESLSSGVSSAILAALRAEIGVKSPPPVSKPVNLPQPLVNELKIKRSLERNWKSLNRSQRLTNPAAVAAAEELFLSQKLKVSDLLHLHRKKKRSSILEQCKGQTRRSLKNFWSYVSPSNKQSTVISAVVNPRSGAVKCNDDDIRSETEDHLLSLFQGSYNQVPPEPAPPYLGDHAYADVGGSSFPGNPVPTLSNLDDGGSLETNPSGWLESPFSYNEIKKVVKKLENGKARGWDNIPNEALKNLPDEMLHVITRLFNMIKSSGTMPHGWNRGRITLIHKRGQREVLGNYRPITVIISLSGLYSRVLNERLISVVEQHKLLGEIQNGFRKERCAADNSFVLDTILWKARAAQKKVHLGFIDICKAYDTVNRDILWRKLSSIGIKGNFLSTLMSIYKDDSIDCMVNGTLTRPIYLRRGLRQGCSLSPLLFALYISDVGIDIHSSRLGFQVGNVCVSGLLFADDLVLVGRTSSDLQTLLNLVKKRFDALKLRISDEKSEIISPDDVTWNLLNRNYDVDMSLKKAGR